MHHQTIIDFVQSRGFSIHYFGLAAHTVIAMLWLMFVYMAIFFEDAPYRIPGLIPVDNDALDTIDVNDKGDDNKKIKIKMSPLPAKTRRGRSKSTRRSRRQTQSMDN